jgi:ubiquinol-cytochrome c reductase cytochrome c subunit
MTFIALFTAAVLAWAAPQANDATAGVPAGNADSGKKLFVSHGCWTCHGYAAQGGEGSGPRLAGKLPAWPAFSKYVRQPTDNMIPYTAKVLPDQALADIYAWIRAIPRPPAPDRIPILKD